MAQVSNERFGKSDFVMCSAEMQQIINAAVSEASDASSRAEMRVAADDPNGSDLRTT